MTERVDRFCDNLRDQLNKVEDRLDGVKTSIKTAQDQTHAAVQAKLDQVNTHIDSRRQEIKEAKARFETRVEQKKTETVAQIDEWKANREQKKLEKRADNLEDYAAAAIEIAVYCVEEAELATLEAVDARMVADEAAGVRA